MTEYINTCNKCGKTWHDVIEKIVCSSCKSELFKGMDNGDPCGYLTITLEYMELKEKE